MKNKAVGPYRNEGGLFVPVDGGQMNECIGSAVVAPTENEGGLLDSSKAGPLSRHERGFFRCAVGLMKGRTVPAHLKAAG
jgi:hypothetical protein